MDGNSTPLKSLDLDKICRVCLTIKKDMRPLFGEMIAEMLMDCTKVQIENTDGWPDKICIQCVHQVSRCHAFKTRVEKTDLQLRQYIKGITVIVEEPITQIELQRADIQPQHIRLEKQLTHQHQQQQQQQHQQHQHQQQQQHIQIARNDSQINQRQEIHLTRADVQTADGQPQQLIITNGQLHNTTILNTGQFITTANGQQVAIHQLTPTSAANGTVVGTIGGGGGGSGGIAIGGTPTIIGGNQQNQNPTIQTGQICQLVQTANGTVQMIQNGQPAQVVQIQRTSDDRCEIIVQPDLNDETHFYTEDELNNIVTVAQAMNNNQQQQQQHHQQDQEHQQQEDEEDMQSEEIHHIEEIDDIIEEVDEEEEDEEISYTVGMSEESECEDKEFLAEFITMQTSCPSPGRFICNLCRKEFKHSKWLQSHMKSHSNWIKANCKKQPQCNVCGRSFKGPGMLKMHMKTHEKSPEKIPTCKICNKEFKSKTILYRHRQTHMEKYYQCTGCNKVFSTIGQLQSHQQKLNHEKIFQCAQCNKIFPTANELKLHIPVHHVTGTNKGYKKDGSSSG